MSEIKEKIRQIIYDTSGAWIAAPTNVNAENEIISFIESNYVPKEGYSFLKAGYDSLYRDFKKLKEENERLKGVVLGYQKEIHDATVKASIEDLNKE